MNPRATALVSIAVIALAAGATLVARSLRPPPPPPPAASNQPVFPFDPDSVRSLDLTAWQGGIRAERRSGGWIIEEVRLRRLLEDSESDAEPAPTPTAAETDKTLGDLVREIVALPVIDRFPRDGRPLAEYGLEEPQAVIALGLADGSTRRLEIGSLTLTSTALYARAAPPDDVIEVGTLLFSAIDGALFRLRSLAKPAAP